jgi:hypothetical protein
MQHACMSQGVYLHVKALDTGMLGGEGEGAGVFREERCAEMIERQEATRVEGSSRQSISTCSTSQVPFQARIISCFPHRGHTRATCRSHLAAASHARLFPSPQMYGPP